jgi:secondary thiamine-phosphate synthase enzyme
MADLSPSLAELGEALRAARKWRGWTQNVLAPKAGLSSPYIALVERGRANPSYDTLSFICKGLDVKLSELIALAEDMAEGMDPAAAPQAGAGAPDTISPMWLQREIRLPARPRGFHLVTGEVVAALPEVEEMSVGLVHLLIQHTSASLALNENAAPEVRRDFESWFDQAVPEGAPYWTHTLEGPDDMPAHIKAALLGPSLTLPVREGRLALGTWQGIYLCEHRDQGGPRSVVATVSGEGDER